MEAVTRRPAAPQAPNPSKVTDTHDLCEAHGQLREPLDHFSAQGWGFSARRASLCCSSEVPVCKAQILTAPLPMLKQNQLLFPRGCVRLPSLHWEKITVRNQCLVLHRAAPPAAGASPWPPTQDADVRQNREDCKGAVAS